MKQIEIEYAIQLEKHLGKFTQKKKQLLGSLMDMDDSWNPTSWLEAAPTIYNFDQSASRQPIKIKDVEGNVEWLKIDFAELVA